MPATSARAPRWWLRFRQLRAHSARAGTTPLITPAQLAAARTRPTQTERDQVAGLPGRARLLATPGPDGTVVVVAASLAVAVLLTGVGLVRRPAGDA